MNSYDLSRAFWNWAFNNPEKVSPNHAAIYFFAIEHCNRLGWKSKFGFPSQMTMDAIGIKKHSTYIKYFNDLVEWKFFKLVQKSKNQYSSNIISLTSAMPKKGEALDKAIVKHREKQTESIGKSKRSINKPLTNNQETINYIIDYLNTASEKKFKTTSKKTIDLIQARIKEGFNILDFEKVIDIKVQQWKHDKQMNCYLRPETLFGNKFEGYLNESYKPERKIDIPL